MLINVMLIKKTCNTNYVIGVARISQWGRGFDGGLGAEPPALGGFCTFFNKNNAFLFMFRPKYLF